MLDDNQMRGFGEAVVISREGAKQVGYGTVSPEYMQEFGRLV